MIVFTWAKDAVLCLLVCSLLANIGKKKSAAFLSLGIIFVLLLMGIDL